MPRTRRPKSSALATASAASTIHGRRPASFARSARDASGQPGCDVRLLRRVRAGGVVADHGRAARVPADRDPAMGRPARDGELRSPCRDRSTRRSWRWGCRSKRTRKASAWSAACPGPTARPGPIRSSRRRSSSGSPHTTASTLSRSRRCAGRGSDVLSDAEQAVWELDQRINARGIAIDVGFVEAAKRIADQVMGEAIAEFVQLTGAFPPFRCRRPETG